MSSALLVRDDGNRTLQLTAEAQNRCTNALESAALVAVVESPDQNEVAVNVQRELKTLLADVEKARKAAKEPVLEFGRMIDHAVAGFRRPLDIEFDRVSRAVADFAAVQAARLKAQIAARLLEEQNLERERLQALAIEIKRQQDLGSAESIDQIAAINERFAQEQAALPAVPEPERAESQIVREIIVIEEIREFELMRARPDLVRKVEFDLVRLKMLLAEGQKIAGIKWRREIQATVQTRRSPVLEIE